MVMGDKNRKYGPQEKRLHREQQQQGYHGRDDKHPKGGSKTVFRHAKGN